MAQFMQFQCPACQTRLNVPMAAAGQKGPCPACGSLISAPIPENLTSANPAWFEPFQVPREPIVPFDERAFTPKPSKQIPPHEISQAPAVQVDAPVNADSTSPKRGISPAILTLSCLLSGLSMLGAGFLLGTLTHPLLVDRFSKKSDVPTPVTPPLQSSTTNPEPEKTQVVIGKSPELSTHQLPDQTKKDQPDEKLIISNDATQAATALRAFLEAEDWASRSAYVINPAVHKPKMEAYALQLNDGPTAYSNIRWIDRIEQSNKSETWHIFEVIPADGSPAILALVLGTPSGHWVDWESFVEFRDDHFQKFVDAGVESSRVFRLSIAAAEESSSPSNEHFTAYLLNPPRAGREQIGYAKRGSKVDAQIKLHTENGQPFAPMLEIALRKAADGRTFIEVLRIVSPTWHQQGDPIN